MTAPMPSAMRKIVRIVWMDSSGQRGGWATLAELKLNLHFISSIGYVMSEDENSIVLAPHVGHEIDPFVDGAMVIPKCAIIERMDLIDKGSMNRP